MADGCYQFDVCPYYLIKCKEISLAKGQKKKKKVFFIHALLRIFHEPIIECGP